MVCELYLKQKHIKQQIKIIKYYDQADLFQECKIGI